MKIAERTRRRGGGRAAATLLAALPIAAMLLAAPAVRAQTDAPPQAAPPQTAPADGAPLDLFLDTVDVNVVNLEVSVTDEDGRPLHGLTRDDFTVLEDGREMELTNFYEVQSARRVLPPQQAGTEGGAQGDGAGPTALPRDQRLNLAVVVDNANIAPNERKRVLDHLRGELARVVRPGDQVMVATLDPPLHIEQTFTSDLDAVGAALDRIGRSTVADLHLRILRDSILSELSRGEGLDAGSVADSLSRPIDRSHAGPADHARLVLGRIWGYLHEESTRMRRSFLSLEALIDALSGLPARKAVLYVSDGIDARPGLDVLTAFVSVYTEESKGFGVSSAPSAARIYDLTDELARVTRAASANAVTFYTLDALGDRTTLPGPEFGSVTPLVGTVDLSPQDTLIQLAAATGGDTMLNPGNVGALVDVLASDHSDYYSLGYASDHPRDGKFHSLSVRVRDVPRRRVRHTEGYEAKDEAEAIRDLTRSALMLNIEDNPLEVRIEVGAARPESAGRYLLPVLVRVPLARLSLVPQGSVLQGRFSLCVAVRDDSGGLSTPQRFEVPVSVPQDQLAAATARDVGYGFNLLVRGGPANLAVGVRDDVAAVSSTVNVKFSAGKG